MKINFDDLVEKAVTGAIGALTVVSCGVGIYAMVVCGKNMKLNIDTMHEQNKLYHNVNNIIENSAIFIPEEVESE